MAAALFPPRGNSPPSMNQVNGMSPRNFLSDFDVDNRYPNTSNVRLSTSSPHMRPPQTTTLPYSDYDSSPLQPPSSLYADPTYMAPQWAGQNGIPAPSPSSRPSNDEDVRNSYFSTRDDAAPDTQPRQTPSIRQQPSFQRDSSSFQGNSRASVIDRRCSVDEEEARGMQTPSRNAGDSRSVSTYVESRPQPQKPTSSGQLQQNYDRPVSHFVPPTSTPKTSMVAYGDRPYSQAPAPSPYPAIQTVPKYRSYAPQPAYTPAPNAAVLVYATPQPLQEETCVECAMRDQDMADVDVTSPGVWDRESDIHFHELARLEHEEEVNGITNPDPSRPRAKGGRLTEQNLKIWLSVNPREPASRKQTLEKYIRSQITLLEAEALAHARAMQEAKQLDSRMKDAYSQLRRSAYDTGNSATAADDLGGVRIKPPYSLNEATHAAHTRSHSRDVTLLENGMIVEHVDVRKEEKEARERQRKEEKRARKASRSSTMDVTSVYSTASQSTPVFESSTMATSDSRYLPVGAANGRPTSVLTVPMERPRIPRASSQASFSDVHSLGSLSPRRTRFFGFKNLSGGFRSQDSLAPSGYTGSMVDMHIALHHDEPRRGVRDSVSPLRRSQVWPPSDPTAEDGDLSRAVPEGKTGKQKKRGLRKIWSIVTGSKSKDNNNSRSEPRASQSQPLDDVPLAPPPSLSYLVNRATPGELSSARHSTASLHSTVGSPRLMTPGVSPPTAPSSLLPSPSSSRPDMDAEPRKSQGGPPFVEEPEQIPEFSPVRRIDDSRGRMSTISSPQCRPMSAVSSREKSLPPLPVEGQLHPQARPPNPYQQEIRPRTMYTYDPRALPLGASPPSSPDFLPPQAPFRTENARRQSFGGITNRPQLHLQTMPALGGTPDRKSFGIRYDEFGSSRRSLGGFDLTTHDQVTPSTNTKRKSRFGLVSLFGKKPQAQVQEPATNGLHQFPSTRSGSSGDEDTTNMGNNSFSRHSTAPRMSMISVSRKVEELIPQEPDFVAYRYPSNDQELSLLR